MRRLAALALVFGFASASLAAGPVPLPNTDQLDGIVHGTTLTICGLSAPTAANEFWSLGIGYDGTFDMVSATATTFAAAGDLRSINPAPAWSPPGFDVTIGGSPLASPLPATGSPLNAILT